jgi:regulator of sigma D
MSEELIKQGRKISKQLRKKLVEIKAVDDGINIFLDFMGEGHIKDYERLLLVLEVVHEQLLRLENRIRYPSGN